MEFKELISKVEEFHKVFNLDVSQNYKANPDCCSLRHALMAEENDEYIQACLDNDNVGIADALGDKLYILLGTIISHGLQDKIQDIFLEIHRSNMTKLDENGKPLYGANGKVKKSHLYEEPKLEEILNN